MWVGEVLQDSPGNYWKLHIYTCHQRSINARKASTRDRVQPLPHQEHSQFVQKTQAKIDNVMVQKETTSE